VRSDMGRAAVNELIDEFVMAVQKVFPDVPHQLCQTHFLKNCAEPMEQDLKDLGASVGQRAEQVRKLQKRLDKKQGRPGRSRDTLRNQAAATPPSPAPAPAASPSPPPAPAAAARPSPPSAPAATTTPSPPPAPAAVTPGSTGAALPQVRHEAAPVQPCSEPLTEEELVRQLSSLARLGARRSGKAPLHPPELVRHQQLEQVREAALEAAKKKTARPPI
jgi:hypothetical protein